MAILYLRFGAKALQDNFVAELSTHYQNYILYVYFMCASQFGGGGVRKFVNPELHVTLRVKRLPPWPFFAPYTELHSRLSITSFLTCKLCSLTYPAPAEFLSFYGLLNFYLYTLAFVYSPSKNAVYGKFWCISSVMHLTWNFLHKEIRCCFFCLFFFFFIVHSDSQLKDNPAFSMLNDSDDEVIYGYVLITSHSVKDGILNAVLIMKSFQSVCFFAYV